MLSSSAEVNEATHMVPRPSDDFVAPPSPAALELEDPDVLALMALGDDEEQAAAAQAGAVQPGGSGGGGGGDPTDKALKLERFSGAPNTISLVEWRRRFVALSAARGWTWPVVLAKLKAFLTGPAARLVDVYQLPQDPKAAVEAVWVALDKAYGLTPSQAIARLRAATYDPAVPGPSVDDLAANIIEWCTVAWGFLSPADRDSVAATLFWASLPKTSQTKHIYGQLTAGKQPGSLTLVASVEAARPLFEEERDAAVELSLVGAPAPPQGGPTRQRGPPGSRAGSSGPYGKGRNRGRRGGAGKGKGRSSSLDEMAQLTSLLKSFMRSHSHAQPSPGGDSAAAESRKCFACDTGCSLTLLPRSVVRRLGAAPDPASASLLHGSHSSRIHGIAGATTGTVCVVLDEPLPSIAGRPIDGLLGMDFVSACGSVAISYDADGFPLVRMGAPTTALPNVPSALLSPVGCTATSSVPRRDFGVQVTDGCDCPVSRLHDLGTVRSDTHTVVTDVVETGDFVLRKLSPQSSPDVDAPSFWEVEWKWLDGVPPRHIMPPDYGTAKHNARLVGLWHEAVEEWISGGWVVPTPLEDLQATSPLLLIPQEHKLSTPVRPVIDLKWINDRLCSLPNELRAGPIECPSHIRRWRAFPAPLEELRLLDLRKAFLQIHLLDHQSYYIGLRLRWKDPSSYRMVRLPFGLAISPKVLEVVLDRVLSPFAGQLDKYLDDIILPASLVDSVRRTLLSNGFPTKPPEPLLSARVLGLQCSANGWWHRRGPVPVLEQFSRRGVHRWAGRFVSHYPLAGWARPAFSAIKRLACVRHDGHKALWDEPLDPQVLHACECLQRDIDQRGDSVGGQWQYNLAGPWRLFTDSSQHAYGTVLCIGGVTVEDATHLRRVGDRRHINLAELDALVRGLQLVDKYIRALRWTSRLPLTICCDNRSAVSWVTRHLAKHWRSVAGLHSTLVENRLRTLRDITQALRLDITVEYVESGRNLADPLSRIPSYCHPRNFAVPAAASALLVPPPADRTRDADGRVVLTTADALRPLADALHDHEGSQSLYGRLRELVSFPNLREYCRSFVRDCPACRLGKVTVSAAVEAGLHRPTPTPRAVEPWQGVHMDIVGPYKDHDLFITTLVDNFSGYLLVRVSRSTPTAQVAASLFRDVFERFNTLPVTVYHDGGSQFLAAEFLAALRWAGSVGCRSPVASSWTNGKVERVHRVLNERVRCHVPTGLTFAAFKEVVTRATIRYNTAPVRRHGFNPHQLLFTFPAWPFPGVDPSFRPLSATVEVSTPSPPPAQSGAIGRRSRVPQVGEIWLTRRHGLLKKHSRPFELCRILRQLSSKVFIIRTATSTRARPAHLHHLKFISPTAAARLDLGALRSPGEGGV
ncbi:hypothetical protein FOZ63_025105 [Perkinsus olseni]|uniref:Integrase catalytic domain-containing protein n=1 Tax=Perkinsus olseni TaxID=32597 RepID=A0A7J6UKP8_PEROL|nr:hypothetical protein FOZ62_023398 [Perkinsus olseni]KAF4757588.1 hypothetical protein FOZ63_025105 [Perkinsus olseni]